MKSEAGGKKIKRSPPSAKIIKNMKVESDLPEGAEIVGLSQTFVSLFKKIFRKNFFRNLKRLIVVEWTEDWLRERNIAIENKGYEIVKDFYSEMGAA